MKMSELPERNGVEISAARGVLPDCNGHERWLRRFLWKFEFTGFATCGIESRKFASPVRPLPQMRQSFRQDRGSNGILRRHQAVMHPASLASRGDDSGAAKIGQVPRNFRLADAEDLDEVANADFPVPDKVQQAEARGIGQGAKEKIERERFFLFGHARSLYMA
jgi:hypothetical protein